MPENTNKYTYMRMCMFVYVKVVGTNPWYPNTLIKQPYHRIQPSDRRHPTLSSMDNISKFKHKKNDNFYESRIYIDFNSSRITDHPSTR